MNLVRQLDISCHFLELAFLKLSRLFWFLVYGALRVGREGRGRQLQSTSAAKICLS